MRSGKRVAIICSSGIAAKGRFFHDSDISKKMGRLVTRQTMLVLFYYFFKPFKFRRACGVCSFELWLARKNNCLLSSTFPAGEGGFGQMMYWSPERSPQDSGGMEFFCTVPRPHFLGLALIWPGYFGEHVLGLFGLYPSSLSKSVGFVSLSGKASLVSISAAILFLRSWHVCSNFVEKVVLKGSMERLLPCLKLMSVSYLV